MTKYKKFVTALKKPTEAARVKVLLELVDVVTSSDHDVREALAAEPGLLPALVSCLKGGQDETTGCTRSRRESGSWREQTRVPGFVELSPPLSIQTWWLKVST